MEPFLGSVMPPSRIGPPSPRGVNDQTESPAVRDEFAVHVNNCEAFRMGFVEPLLFAPEGAESRDLGCTSVRDARAS